MELTKEEFCDKYRISEEKFEKANISWEELTSIHDDHEKNKRTLGTVVNSITQELLYLHPVHSVRGRVKDSEHLIEKIIRKRSENQNRIINLQNYHSEIQDLIGVRALHLHKEQWLDIHDHLVNEYEIHDTPSANIREGDPKEWCTLYEQKGCKVKNHPAGYRSVHYILRRQPKKRIVFAELQVRTLFEEGWSEIDHNLRYPYNTDNKELNKILLLFNRVTGVADELASLSGTFAMALEKTNGFQKVQTEQKVSDLIHLVQSIEGNDEVKEKILNILIPKQSPAQNGEIPKIEGDTNNLVNLAAVLGGAYGVVAATNPWIAVLSALVAAKGFKELDV